MMITDTYPGLRVLDLATNIAGPFAAMILGDMGADVIKIERPPTGDDTRNLPPFHDGEATVFLTVNRNKRSILLDIKSPEGREALMRLIDTADVVIESFPPGLAKKLDLTFDTISARTPRTILCSISAFGDGPLGSTMPGYDALVQAVSGLMSFTGSEGSPTVRIAPSVLDLGTGMWAAMGIMAALARRGTSGIGEHLNPALIDTAFTLMNHQLLGFLATGETPRKFGSGAPSAAPYGVFHATDGEIMIATASEPQFPRLCAAIGLDALIDDPRFATMPDRLANRAPLDAAIAGRISTKTVGDWLTIIQGAGISAGRVNTVADACDLPVVEERGFFHLAPSATADKDIPQLRLPLDKEGKGVRFRPPALGEHSVEILTEIGLA